MQPTGYWNMGHDIGQVIVGFCNTHSTTHSERPQDISAWDGQSLMCHLQGQRGCVPTPDGQV